jgi:peptidoglycan/LPS O-acetylase OafA/YrhL
MTLQARVKLSQLSTPDNKSLALGALLLQHRQQRRLPHRPPEWLLSLACYIAALLYIYLFSHAPRKKISHLASSTAAAICSLTTPANNNRRHLIRRPFRVRIP